MSIKMTVEGIEIELSSPAEAAALLRELRTKAPANESRAQEVVIVGDDVRQSHSKRSPRIIKRNPRVVVRKEPSLPAWAAPNALKFLTTIRDAGVAGAGKESIMKALGVSEPKGVGSRSATINRLLDQMELKPERVYTRYRTPHGRVWKSRKLLGDAIAALEKRITAGE